MPFFQNLSRSINSLDASSFSLDTSAVVGVFGGEQAVSAMGTIPLYKNWKWLGWYNSPGSYEIAKRYGGLAKSRFFDGLFPGSRTDPATLFEMDGTKGPKFEAAHSGTVIEETSHLADLFMKECHELDGKAIKGRQTQPVGVTIADLKHEPPTEVILKQVVSHSPIVSSIPILVSAGTCITCAFIHDWFSGSMILLGMVVSGISCLVIGSGTFIFTHPEPAPGSPPGDGIICSEKEFVLLRGKEGAVNAITRGKFGLRFKSQPNYHDIGWCSILLMTQFLAQLLLIPQGKLLGQLMFVISIAVSWGHNMWLSSLNKEKIQRQILMNEVLRQPTLTRYIFPNRTSMVVFILLASHSAKLEKLVNDLLPNETKVWGKWKATIIERLKEGKKLEFQPSEWEDPDFCQEERILLETLYQDAQAAYYGYLENPTPLTRRSNT
ncbi:hypothetical protein SCLCIDRAFT_1210884 [Scleroderma citrinum Foug A]|uniref:Uncharacterized protein n=1 Tax=Scleroderma citrinum Foug A TaxID=1036808 RepID=A0A0C3EEW0_9AGAM|nr:hypothetical protein SCLCIDRAFT_1210884 [Scleroderma citrinum Foug A]